MKNKMSYKGTPIAHVMRKDEPMRWTPPLATNLLECLIYEAALIGDKYDCDNEPI